MQDDREDRVSLARLEVEALKALLAVKPEPVEHDEQKRNGRSEEPLAEGGEENQ